MTSAPFVLATALSMAGVLPIGKPAPESTVKMKNAVDGKLKSVSIADVTGKGGTLVVFTCDHCPFARGWEARIVELGNTYVKKGVGVILINANDPSEHEEDGFAGMQARAKSADMQIPYVVDETSNVARAFGATVTPEVFLFDRHGKLAYHGAVDDNRKEPDKVQNHYLKDALDAVVSGKPPAPPETKSLGCSIKYRPSS
jgi:peroxiredoxin